MSNKRSFWILSLSLLSFFCVPVQKAVAQYDNSEVTYDDFYQNLAPYGQWIEDPQYGYVWSPTVDGNFRPYYTNGHWVMTEYGNTWVSDYIWGWACFHYGRWTFDTYYGWLWIPGSEWGPAWVCWRSGDGFYGWAPLGPGYQFGPSFVEYSCPNDWWVFIPPQYVYTGNYYHYWNGPRGNGKIMRSTTVMNNTYENNHVTYVSGPHASQVQQVTGTPVQVFHVRNSGNRNTRVHNSEVRMYRPAEIKPTARNADHPVPPNVVAAPQPVHAAQPISNTQSATPPFRNNIPDNTQRTPGANFNETAQPSQPRQHNETHPYEWDVNRAVPQGEPLPTQQTRQYTQPQPTRQNTQPPRQNPQPQQPVRQNPQPQQPVRQNPQPQQPPRQAQPAPAPAKQAPAQNSQPGGRR
jgi:hypothetical protein